MADYIAYIDDDNIISVDEYKEKFIDTDIKQKPKLFCLCRKPLFYRSSSIKVVDDEELITKYHCFYHEKHSKCIIRETFRKNSKYKKDLIPRTEQEKRLSRLCIMIDGIIENIDKYDTYRYTARNKLKKARPYDNYIIDKSYITENIIYLLSLEKIWIGFNQLRYIEVSPLNFYCIGDIRIVLECGILKKVADDMKLYINYLKQLSIITLFYSRCDNNTDKMKADMMLFEDKIERAITNGKYNMLIHLDKQVRH